MISLKLKTIKKRKEKYSFEIISYIKLREKDDNLSA